MAEKIRLVLLVPDAIRKALRLEAARQDIDMSDLAPIVLNHALGLMAEGKTPPAVAAAIKQFKQHREAEKAARELDRTRGRNKPGDN